jgi:putative radical SAM enzyme (TIGR03279 family)
VPIAGVRPGSPAHSAGIEPGDVLVEVGGVKPRDAVDVQFYGAGELVSVLVAKRDGLFDMVEIEKEYDEDLGLEFETATWDGIELCNNNCFFCFLKGLPRGMRKSLYIKDDDYRLSFLHGNFVTLTNLREADWERLAEQRLSPLNVSVHATDVSLRRRMLANANAPDIVEQLRRLGGLDIVAHTQVVLCPGVNDGAALEQTLGDLVALYPTVQTVSVVPVGASPKLETWSLERDGIPVSVASPAYASEVLGVIGAAQRAARRAHGRTVVQCSDEFYLTAGARVPGAATYDGFPQYENGIGMVRTHLDDWARTRRRLTRCKEPRYRSIVAASGTLAAPVLASIASELEGLTGVRCRVVPVENTVFGARVNVAGLVNGCDWRDALAGCDEDLIVLPRTTLDYFGERFLDGISTAEMSDALGKPVLYASQWSEIWDAVSGNSVGRVRNVATNGAMWSAGREERYDPRG